MKYTRAECCSPEAYKKLVRVVDVVLMRIHAGTMDGPVLVHTEAPSE